MIFKIKKIIPKDIWNLCLLHKLAFLFKERTSLKRNIPHVTCGVPSCCYEGVTLEKQPNLDIAVYRCESKHLQSLRQGDPRSRFFFSHIIITSHFNNAVKPNKKHCQRPLDNPRWQKLSTKRKRHMQTYSIRETKHDGDGK